MDVVRTCCKLSRIHHAFTALSLRPHYVRATSLAFSPRPYRASSTFIQSPRRLHCVLITSLRFLTRSYPVCSRFLLRPPRLIESFNHFQIQTFFATRSPLPLPLTFLFRPLFRFLSLIIVHLRVAEIKFSRVMRNRIFAHAKTKAQISCAVNEQLISAFVFAIQMVQSLFFLNPKFQASFYLLWLYSPVCVRSVRKPRRRVFS